MQERKSEELIGSFEVKLFKCENGATLEIQNILFEKDTEGIVRSMTEAVEQAVWENLSKIPRK